MRISMLDLARLHRALKPDLMRAFASVVDSGQFIGGHTVERFENNLARYVGAENAVGMSSGTDGLLAVLSALGVGPGDEVITTGYSFFATAGSIARLGAVPVFADIDLDTFNIDPAAVEAAVTPKTVGIVPVHLFGQCAEMTPILALAKKKGLFVVEDAAQSMGATYQGKMAGTMGTAGVFSFFPAKNLGALGDAGAVVTGDPQLAAKLRQLRTHGAIEPHVHEMLGGNFRLDALQASQLNIKLPHLKNWESLRAKVVARYREGLADLEDFIMPTVRTDCSVVNNQFVIRTSKRDTLREGLKKNQIDTAVYYPMPLNRQPCFKAFNKEPLKNCEEASATSLALPVDPMLTETEQRWVVTATRGTMLGKELQGLF